jgi:hypothetical protein
MAKSPPSGIVIQYDNAGGTPVDISQYVLTINEFNVESLMEEVHTMGDSWEEYLPVGIGKLGQIEIGGLWDDTASVGPDALFANRVPETPTTATRTLTITWAGSKTSSVETVLQAYNRAADRNALTKFTAILQPYGVVTEV